MTRANIEVYISNTESIGGRTVKALNGMGGDGAQGFEIQTLGRDVVQCTRVENEGTFSCTSEKNLWNVRQDR